MELNKIYNEDCLIGMKRIPDKSIDMVLTSPPYDNLRTYKGYTFNFEGIAQEIYRVLKDGGVCVWVVGDATIKGSETGTSFKQALYFKEIGFNLHDTMIYYKNGCPYPSSNRYYQQFEYMFVLSKGKPKTANLIMDKPNNWFGKKIIGTWRNPDGTLKQHTAVKNNTIEVIKEFGVRTNVWQYSPGYNKSTKDKYAYKHPAIFPEKLAQDHILSWSNEGDIVLDPMAGSGTTLKMAIKNNRNYIGFEISKEYVDIINKRIDETKSKKESYIFNL